MKKYLVCVDVPHEICEHELYEAPNFVIDEATYEKLYAYGVAEMQKKLDESIKSLERNLATYDENPRAKFAEDRRQTIRRAEEMWKEIEGMTATHASYKEIKAKDKARKALLKKADSIMTGKELIAIEAEISNLKNSIAEVQKAKKDENKLFEDWLNKSNMRIRPVEEVCSVKGVLKARSALFKKH